MLRPLAARSWRSSSGVTRKLVPGTRAHGAGEDVVDRERPAGLQHAIHLSIEPSLVGDVHRNVLAPDHVEDCIGKRQVERVALSITYEPG
jgi:hypothetical protein